MNDSEMNYFLIEDIMKKLLLTVFTALLLSGCMNFNKFDIPDVTIDVPKSKPIIGLVVGNFKQYDNGSPISSKIISNKDMGMNCMRGLLDPWKKNELIGDFAPLEKLKKNPDYILTINGTIDENSSNALNIISLLTVFIVPAYQDVDFKLSFVLTDNKNGKDFEGNFDNAFTIWKNLIFLPVCPLFWVRMDRRIYKRSMFLYSKFAKQGAFNN